MYDFDKLTDRMGSDCCKWDVKPGELPMWIADMDFEAPYPVKRELLKVAEHGIYGYAYAPDEYFRSVCDFRKRRHGQSFLPSQAVFATSVVASISSGVRKLTTPAENVLIQAPVYNVFYNSILNSGRNVLSSDLVYENGEYSIDFADLEAKLENPETTLMILCNPHNPVGKLYTKEELAKIGELCHKHGVTVISDEIHSDFVKPGKKFVPFAEVNELCSNISVTLVSASKTFNLAGLHASCVLSRNPHLLHKMYRGLNTDECGEPNAFAMRATIAAYRECDEWLDGVVDYIYQNRAFAEGYILENIKGVHLVPAEATYFLWIDVSRYTESAEDFCRDLREKTGLFVNSGHVYGEGGRRFIRINLATQRERVRDGLERLKAYVDSLS